jgi:hypothetical protein
MFFMVIFVMKIHSICVSQFKKKKWELENGLKAVK